MLSDSCFFSPWWSLSVVEQNFLLSSYHAVFGLRHRDKSAKVIGLSGQTRGKGIPLQASFHRKRLRWRMQTFTMAGANVCDGGCKRLRDKAHSFGERLRSCPTWSGNLSCEQWPADKRGRRQGPRLSSCDIPDWDDRHPLTDNLLPRTRPLQNRDSFHWAVWER